MRNREQRVGSTKKIEKRNRNYFEDNLLLKVKELTFLLKFIFNVVKVSMH